MLEELSLPPPRYLDVGKHLFSGRSFIFIFPIHKQRKNKKPKQKILNLTVSIKLLIIP